MSSTPIYDELAATYLADLTPEHREPAGPPEPAAADTRRPAHTARAGQQAKPAASQAPPRGRPKP